MPLWKLLCSFGLDGFTRNLVHDFSLLTYVLRMGRMWSVVTDYRWSEAIYFSLQVAKYFWQFCLPRGIGTNFDWPQTPWFKRFPCWSEPLRVLISHAAYWIWTYGFMMCFWFLTSKRDSLNSLLIWGGSRPAHFPIPLWHQWANFYQA